MFLYVFRLNNLIIDLFQGTDDVSPADILPGGSTRQGEDIDEEVIHEQENNNRYVYVKPSEAGCGVGTAVANNVIVEEDEDEFLEIDNGNDKANRSNVVETRPIECGISPNATPRGVCKNMSVSLPVSVVASVDTSGPPSQNTSNSALHSASKDTSMSSSGQQNVLPIFSESRDFESKNVLVATPKQTSSSVRSSPSAEICVTSPRPHSDVGVHTPPHSAALLISQESSSGARSLGSLDQQDNPVLFSEEFEHEIDRRLTARLELERAKWERQAIVVFIKYEANKPLPIVCVPPLSWHKLRDRCCSVVSLVSDHCTSLDVDGIVISDDVGCDSVKWVSGMTITVRTPSVSGSISATASATASSSDVTKVGSESHTKIEPVRKSGGALPKPVTASSNSLKSPAGRPRAGSTGSPNITAKPQRSSSPIAGRANSGLLSPATAQTPSLKTYAAPSSKTPERGSLSLSGEPHKRTMSTPIKAPVKAVPEKKPSSTVSKK